MIVCEFIKKGSFYVSFEISGHALYAKKGKDIVCAAVSSVSQHTARVLEVEGAVVKIEEGYLKVEKISKDEISQRFVEELVVTLKDIEEQYPRYVRVDVRVEVSDDAH
ncbi:MAG: ribosomal-processing cysteine protease Prp [Fervidobacterium sp.]|uniref:ribosomal-processing cysteine protease Prp n=1 Tax=Fervidobacterium sp. TaxID=1871331 RepID=UPI00404B09D5